MRATWLAPVAVVVVIAAFIGYLSMAVVTQTQQAIVLQFGALVRVVKDPGLMFIMPFTQTVRYFDKRILSLEMSDPVGVTTLDKKRIDVDSFARYRIADPVRYYQSATTDEAAQQRLATLMNSSLRRVLGRQDFSVLLSADREKLMREIRDGMQEGANDFGVEIVDVRIRRADLPTENQTAVFKRMQAERQQEAEGYRAQGDEDALKITADADKQATVIKADATRKSDILRGEGEAERNRILSEAFSKDPQFFEFYRSLKAYEASMTGQNTTVVMSPDNPFFKYFQRGQSGGHQ
ncbi:MAG: protease modulator HflC [Alphaproteobacteria bacterium]|nr:protease modulator HflC [Alphaproteobacteria bacterium]